MPATERVKLLYRAGHLRFKFQPHQLQFYDSFHRWNQIRQTRDHLRWVASIGGQFDNMWVNRWSRRTGKTSDTLLLGEEACIRYANRTGKGAIGMIAIPMQKKIGGVIVPLVNELFADAPAGYRPEYRVSGQGLHEHLYIPAIESRIILVGTDAHPKALRGTYLDWFAYTEAGFAGPGLYGTYVEIIQHQFQNRPWAWSLLESSEPPFLDHDFTTRFRRDAELRGTFSSMVITDNTSLTEEQIELEIRRSGGREAIECKRELFNENDPDPDQMLVPEFDASVHVVDPAKWPQPTHALAIEGLDPGTTDPFGVCWMYFDFEKQCIVVQGAWQKPNASTGQVVRQLREFEREFWGTDHGDPRERYKPELSIADAVKTGADQVWEAPWTAMTYWDPHAETLVANPYSRISDVAKRMILDMNNDFKLQVRAADKSPGTAEADLLYVRELFRARHPNGQPHVVILNNGRTVPLIQQLRSGMWNTDDVLHRTDWLRSKELGHCDVLAAFKYAVRDVPWQRDPRPPPLETIDKNRPGFMRAANYANESAIGTYNMFGEREWR